MPIFIHTYMNIHIQYIGYDKTGDYLNGLIVRIKDKGEYMYVCMYLYVCIYIDVYIYVYVCIYKYMHIYVYICIYVYILLCIYIYKYIYIGVSVRKTVVNIVKEILLFQPLHERYSELCLYLLERCVYGYISYLKPFLVLMSYLYLIFRCISEKDGCKHHQRDIIISTSTWKIFWIMFIFIGEMYNA
jgi:hypothetical protein